MNCFKREFFLTSCLFVIFSSQNLLAACEKKDNVSEQMMQNSQLLQNNHERTLLLYNFHEKDCKPLSESQSDFNVSNFLPMDETPQGLFILYRKDGFSRMESLKKVYQKLAMLKKTGDATAAATD